MKGSGDVIHYVFWAIFIIGAIYGIIQIYTSTTSYIWTVLGALVGVILLVLIYFKLKQ